MKKIFLIICVSLFLMLSGSVAFACVADHRSNQNGGDALNWDAWEDSQVQDFSQNRYQKKIYKKNNYSSHGMSDFSRSDRMGFDGGTLDKDFVYGGGSSNGSGNPFWYNGSAMIDFYNLLSLLSNFNLFAGVDDTSDDGQLVGEINIGGTLYSITLNQLDSVETSQVPVPGTLLLLGSSAGLLAITKRRKG